MPPVPECPGTCRIYITGTSTDWPMNRGTIFHLNSGNAPTDFTEADLTAIANAFVGSGSLINPFLPSTVSSFTYTEVVVKGLGALDYQAAATLSRVGTSSGTPLPPQCTVALSWQSPYITWRGGRPRNYLPGIPTAALSYLDAPYLQPTYASTLATAALSFQTNINALTGLSGGVPTLGFISYTKNAAPRATPVFYGYSGVKVHERIDSQRRRSGKESAFLYVS